MQKVLGVATEVDAEGAGIGIGGEVGLDVVDQAATLAQGHVQATVHAGAAQQVVQQIESRALRGVGIVAPSAYHHMRLVGIAVHGAAGRHVRRGLDTSVRLWF